MKNNKKIISTLIVIMTLPFTNCTSFADNSVEWDNFDDEYSSDAALDGSRPVYAGRVSNVYQKGELMTVEEKEAVLAAMADETKSKVINDIYEGAKSYLSLSEAVPQMMIDLQQYNLTPDDLQVCFQALLNNYPDMYYVNRQYTYTNFGEGLVDACYISFDMTPEEASETQTQIDAEVDNILSLMQEGMSRADEIVVVNDYFTHHYTYDTEHFENPGDYTRHYTIPALFLDKTAVCQGFGLGFQYVMQKLNIPCITVQSTEMNHLWNLVQAKEGSDNWYHIDVTWNTDWVNTGQFTFFLKSDDEFKNLTVYGNTYPHYNYTPDGKATDTNYDNCAFSTAATTPVYGNGGWYYGKSVNDWDKADTIFKYNFLTNSSETIINVADEWALGVYADYKQFLYKGYYFNSAAAYNGKLYYNDARNIYVFDPSTEKSSVYLNAVSDDDKYKESIYSFSMDGNKITYGIATGYGDDYPKTYKTIEVMDTSNSIELNGITLSATLTDISNATDIYCVFYDADGRFLSMVSKKLNGENSASIEEDIPSSAENASVFAVKSSSSGLQPIGESLHSSDTLKSK